MNVSNDHDTRPSPHPRTDDTPTVALPAVVQAHGAHHIERQPRAQHVAAILARAGRPPLTEKGMHRRPTSSEQFMARVRGGAR